MQAATAVRSWLPAITGMVCLGFGAGLIGIYGFFVEPLSVEFGVGVATINMGPVALLLVPGVVAPFVGKLVDRQSIRKIMLCGATLAMAALLAVSLAPTIELVAIAFLFFALGLTLYGPVVVNGLLVKIYTGREARALAIAAMGISLATAILPPVVGILLATVGWRSALMSLAGMILIALWLAILAGIPTHPESQASAADATQEVRSVYGSRTFWLIGLCVALGFNGAIVLAICYPLHFVSQGFSLAQAGWFLSLAGVSGMVGKAVVALFADTLHRYAKWLAFTLLLVQAIGLYWLQAAQSAEQVIPIICMMGLVGGAFLPMHPYLNSQYFDARIIGRVSGAQMPLFLPFGMVGAPLAGYLYDQHGNYLLVLSGLSAVLVVAALLAALLPAGQHVSQSTGPG